MILISAQRTALVRTSTAYRIVSHGAQCVVTGSLPIHIKAKLRWEEYVTMRRYGEESAASHISHVRMVQGMRNAFA